jgi:multiple sugar transport system permease protein
MKAANTMVVGQLSQSRHRRFWQRRGAGSGYLYIVPIVVWFVVFNVFPIVVGLGLSLTDWNILAPPHFVGLINYSTLLGDSLFWQSVANTLYYAVGSVGLGTIVSLGLALALNQKLRFLSVYRTIFFLPAVTALIAVAMVWRWLYDNEYGLINWALSLANVPPLNWLGDPHLAMPAIILMSVWRSAGFNTIIFLAGLQGIPVEYHEAAAIDGAGRWSRFVHVTLPIISPTTFFVVVNSLIGAWQVFDQVWAMTQGNPEHATTTIVFLIYSNGFQWGKTGYASAMAYGLFLAIMVLTWIQFKLQNRWVFYQ